MVPRLLGTFPVRWLRLDRKRNVGVGWHEGRICVLCLPHAGQHLLVLSAKVRGFVC